jgi:hypothetical protein
MAEIMPLLQYALLHTATAETKRTLDKKEEGRAVSTSLIRESDGNLWSDLLVTQRKIPHLLVNEGMGKTFRYFPHLGEAGFQEGDAVLITEKYDGTTMQATGKHFFKVFAALCHACQSSVCHKWSRRTVFSEPSLHFIPTPLLLLPLKRFDNLKKKTKKKFLATAEERYRLEKLDLGAPAHQHIRHAVQPYVESFKNVDEGYCVYFEACNPKIGVRAVTFNVAHHAHACPFACLALGAAAHLLHIKLNFSPISHR